MEVSKHDDEFVEHEHSLGTRPRDRRHREVVNQEREHRTTDYMLHTTNPNEEEEEHAEHGDTELHVELACLLLSYFAVKKL